MKQIYRFAAPHYSKFLPYYILLLIITGSVNAMAISPDGRFIVSGSDDNSIKILDIETKQEVHSFDNMHEGNSLMYFTLLMVQDWVNSVAISPNGRFIVSGSEDNSIKILDMATKQE